MTKRTLIFCLHQVGGLALVILAACLFVWIVGFFAELLYGVSALRALSFVIFMFTWTFAVALLVTSFAVLVRLTSRARKAGVSLDDLAGMSKVERGEFQKKHRI